VQIAKIAQILCCVFLPSQTLLARLAQKISLPGCPAKVGTVLD
jgi:hypothetical protein